MAKGVEDTLFYRDHRFLAFNEVGATTDAARTGVDGFHRAMQARASEAPHALSASATHDTKRGEDARARLLALSEMPDRWIAAVEDWRRRNAGRVRALADGPAPEPDVESLVYQALAGVWPDRLGEQDWSGLKERFANYLGKALREAKLRTGWASTNEGYEKAVQDYAAALLDDADFRQQFGAVLRPAILAGWRNSLAQTLVKLAAPGIPDIYQGSEQADFSLVDPDNRRPVDFARLASELRSGTSDTFPRAKQRLIATVLGLRREMPELFAEGDYLPLRMEGPRSDHLVAFARRRGKDAVIAVAPRLTLALAGESGEIASGVWADIEIVLPSDLRETAFRNLLAGGEIAESERLRPEASLDRHGLGLLLAEGR
jgi:(1->4)-alpha-D-glucan 1-alpha-D-glucosylmutase